MLINENEKPPVLSLHNVSYDYQTKTETVHAVKSASYDFHAGYLYTIVGRSGSGKSTLLSLMAGFDRVKSGEIRYEGHVLTDVQAAEYRKNRLSMIFQSYYLLPQLTVEENILLSLEISGKLATSGTNFAKEKVSALLSETGLPDSYRKKRVIHLSGGEQQRVAIARAIAPEPGILLADEPTGNLDNENSQKVLELLRSFAHDKGVCVIVVTHADSIAEHCDCILTMQDGELVSF